MEENKQNKNAILQYVDCYNKENAHHYCLSFSSGNFSEAIEYFLAYFKKHFEQPVCVYTKRYALWLPKRMIKHKIETE